ncbi:MAG: pyridoxamine 5'-phosphate oxidase [Euryarchaeota archaeon]|nr:pyridoxamine 5'-phosphate oxidase [Euryarchaeota archaeon]|tara:strand:- start:490 stop:1089 length:600 start_codon:yes stop_codon:yes gene_type:complete
MINFINISDEKPYEYFLNYYEKALNSGQSAVQAIAISSFNSEKEEVNARFVNLKYIVNNEWIFFSNYNSQKSEDFKSCSQISGIFYWDSIDIQIRLKAKVFKTSSIFSDKHFASRSPEKNALAIASNQSKPIESFEDIKKIYKETLNNKKKIQKRPDYWGGYSFKPYFFEFWSGNKNRLNKRIVFSRTKDEWGTFLLQP